jgi:hypothetical protein
MAESTNNSADAAGVGEEIAGDLTCLHCGYNLRGLSPKGRCPECGGEISFSISTANNPIADRVWIGRASAGARMYSITLISVLVLIVGSVAARRFALISEGLLLLAFAGGATAGAIAVWLSTGNTKHEWDWHFTHWFWSLRVVSGIAAMAAVAFSVSRITQFDWYFAGMSFQVMNSFVSIWGIFLTDVMFMCYLAKLVWQLPGHIRMWGYVTAARLPLLVLLGCVLLTAPSGGRSGGAFGAIVWPAVYLLMPACLFIWPAAYAWTWARRVAGRIRD